jgi:hypothetical protein
MSSNASTVRACRNAEEHDTEPCNPPTDPAPTPWESSTWPSPGIEDTELRPGVPTTPCQSGLSPLDEALALRHAPLPAEWYELIGLHEVA